MPTYPSSVQDVKGFEPGVEDIPALREVCDHNRGDVIFVVSERRFFFYDDTSTAADDGALVVKPDDVDVADPGRWLLTEPTSTASVARIRRQFNETPDGSRVSFTAPLDFRTDAGFEEWVFIGGKLLRRGPTCDYTVSESGGAGTGFDTVTFTFTPHPDDNLDIVFIPV